MALIDKKQFVNIQFSYENIDRYTVRNSILKALNQNIHNFTGKVLDVGCGQMPYKEYILENAKNVTEYVGLDLEKSSIHNTSIADFHWDGKSMPFDENTFDSAFATEVLEHCPNPGSVLSEINRILKPGGGFFFTVPFLWPLHEVPYDEYRYTPYAMERLLKESGFNNVNITATGGWDMALAQMLGLWIKRRQMNSNKKKMFYYIFRPFIKSLIRTDSPPVNFNHPTMITGLSGCAFK